MKELMLILFQQPPAQPEMTAGGWAFMVVAWLFILYLSFYSFARVLGKK